VLGGIYHRSEHPALALKTLREALHLATTIKDLRGVTASHLQLAEFHIAEERYEQAEEYIELARGALKTDPSQLRSSGVAQRLSGRLELVRGRYAEAHQQIAQSISIFTAVADLYEIGLSHLEMADLHARAGEATQAAAHLEQATELFARLGAAPDLARADELRRHPDRAAPARTTAAAAAPAAAPEHKVSDVLLMQRLIEASASRELLLQELISIIEENFEPGRVLLLGQEHAGEARPELTHGYAEAEAATVARDINWAIASDGRMERGQLFTLEDRAGSRVILHLERPVPSDRLRPLVRQAELGLENCALRDLSRRTIESDVGRPRIETVIPGFILAGARMREVIERIHKIRTSDVTVLITGECGTGNELVARAIHAEGERRRAVFLPFNCTATPKEIIDSQLFGHRRGSFTGATSNYPGIIRAAEGGTLFLDEIGDLALEVQPKLLRFLESGEIQPLGEARPTKVDVRVVAATNNDIERAVEEGRFREDLFHRLNIIRIHVPPLRDRREEIPPLAEYFLRHFSERTGKPALSLTMDAMNALTNYPWPGNVRQLRNEMERVAAYAVAGTRVTSNDLSPELTAGTIRRQPGRSRSASGPYGLGSDRDNAAGHSLKEATALFEKRLIEEALERSGQSLARAARELGLSRRGLHVKMSQLGIDPSAEPMRGTSSRSER
jgi:DNA-binding NtrC family response regulator/tetratricopeptide (TPR) repeat protein